MTTFWAIRRIDRNYVEPTLYKREAAAVSAAARRRGYEVLALSSEVLSPSQDGKGPVRALSATDTPINPTKGGEKP